MIVFPPSAKAREEQIGYSLIIPAYREGDRIGDGLDRLLPCLDETWEVILVISGPVDDAEKEIAARQGRAWLKIMRFPLKTPKGKAILFGIPETKGRILGYTDADAPFEPGGINKLLKPIKDGSADVAIASKWKDNPLGDSKQSLYRRLGGRLFSELNRKLLDLPFFDTQAGLKLFHRRTLPFISGEFVCQGFDFDVELMLRLHISGFRIKEIPLPILSDGGRSSVRPHDLIGVVRRLTTLRSWLVDNGGRVEPVSPHEFPTAEEVERLRQEPPEMELRSDWPATGGSPEVLLAQKKSGNP